MIFTVSTRVRLEPELKGRYHLVALDELEREFENVRSACDWAPQCAQWERLRKSLFGFFFFTVVRSRHREAITLFHHVVDTAAATESSAEESAQRQSRSFSRHGAAVLAQNRFADASGLLTEALAIAEGCGSRASWPSCWVERSRWRASLAKAAASRWC